MTKLKKKTRYFIPDKKYLTTELKRLCMLYML